jgi:lipopolysaccharide biosynthesis protein
MGKLSNSKIGVLFHKYYPESDLFFFNKENYLDQCCFYCNIAESSESLNTFNLIKENYTNSVIITSPNIGKDIGGKLALISTYLQLKEKCDYFLLLHDKSSQHLVYGKKWRDDLYTIATKDNTFRIIEIFEKTPNVGIICSSECISNEYDEEKDEFKTTNNLILKDYIKRFNFKLDDYSFVAGNMFWVRSSIYEEFFALHNPMELRSELEKGNVMDNETGTKTHSLERIFSWIATNQGYKIYGI